MTGYNHTLTAICPESLIGDANELMGAVGLSMADRQTIKQADWEDSQGNKYACVSARVTSGLIGKMGASLTRPDFDTEESIDMVKANAVASNIVTYGSGSPSDYIPTTSLLIAIDQEPLAFIKDAGLARLEPV